MLTFAANPRDGTTGTNACNTCCCEAASARPGETNKWMINYANWVNSIGGWGLVGTPNIVIEDITPRITSPGTNAPPTNTDYVVTTAIGTAVSGNVSSGAVDTDPLTYAHVPLYGPLNGTLSFAPDGSYTYTPRPGFSGYDEFYFTTSDTVNPTIMNKVTVAVNPAAPAGPLPAPPVRPLLYVPMDRVSIANPVASFPLVASPALRPGDIYRMTIRQPAMDCDGTQFWHTACFDIQIGKC